MFQTIQPRPRRAILALSAAFFLLVSVSAAQQPTYSDLPPDHWAFDAVGDLSALGILTGYPDGRFDGTRAATRYEIAVVAARLLETLAGSSTPQAALPPAATQELEALRTALSDAASLAYARRLEARIVALEVALNAQTESETFPAEMEADTDDTSVAALPPSSEAASGLTPVSEDGIDGPVPTLELSRRPIYPFYVGISPGIVSTAGDIYLGLQTGYDGLLGAVGPVVRLTFNGGEDELRFSVDALAKADLFVEKLKLYAGLGLGATLRPSGESLLLEAPFGGEFYLTERASLFVQLTTSYGFAPVSDVGAELTTGINLRF
jgi:hypothetical protein